ncbi:Golgi resident protein GCP60-like isoform X1 [Eriocheir sinensis]|uniref:Golgi resident protein GCP60-like isoform X1 n=1 Tax=Eriocheir sinensis TaxID=95602 RepID=UPI0021CA2939|nr:Golgi resident protein GCP60-like isoform X1 [Eriocheir sinensis]
MENGADPAAAPGLQAGEGQAGAGEQAEIVNEEITNKEHQTEEPPIKPAENGLQVHWGFSLPDLYRIALKFYKEKEGKAVHLGYAEKCAFVGLTQQVTHGPFDPTSSPPIGVLDVVGKDRRLAWQALGPMTREEAKQQFINKLSDLVPTFRPYVEAMWADKLEKERLAKEEEERQKEEEERRKLEEEEQRKEEEERKKQEETKRQIQEALNQQTYDQFRKYAEQQYPGNPEQQAVLIRQLQDQHYQQYMQQVYQQQLLLQQQQQQQQLQQQEQPELPHHNTEEVNEQGGQDSQTDGGEESPGPAENGHDSEGEGDSEEDEDEDSCQNVAPASMWTRRDIQDFKESIKREGGDSVIKVGHGETVTVRVPTHEDGTCLFWEFATDSYDIGFGVYFEWTKDASNVVSVHISESEDEEEEEEAEVEGDDVERLAGRKGESGRPAQSVIIPVYRRDCYEEVYAGSHSYPGTGVYLLKFDNSYSLWRSKTLYYRVYYTSTRNTAEASV